MKQGNSTPPPQDLHNCRYSIDNLAYQTSNSWNAKMIVLDLDKAYFIFSDGTGMVQLSLRKQLMGMHYNA